MKKEILIQVIDFLAILAGVTFSIRAFSDGEAFLGIMGICLIAAVIRLYKLKKQEELRR